MPRNGHLKHFKTQSLTRAIYPQNWPYRLCHTTSMLSQFCSMKDATRLCWVWKRTIDETCQSCFHIGPFQVSYGGRHARRHDRVNAAVHRAGEKEETSLDEHAEVTKHDECHNRRHATKQENGNGGDHASTEHPAMRTMTKTLEKIPDKKKKWKCLRDCNTREKACQVLKENCTSKSVKRLIWKDFFP